MSTRPNPEAEWEARIARIEAAEPAPESWEVLRSHPHRLHLHDGEPWSLAGGRRERLAEALDDTATGIWMRHKHGEGWGSNVADALLPAVDAMIRQAQAEALEEAAAYWDRPTVRTIADDLRERARALRVGNDQPDATDAVAGPESPAEPLTDGKR